MALDALPSGALDTLCDLSENGSSAIISTPTFEFLISSGYVEMKDDTPIVTSEGLDALGSDDTPIPPLPPKIFDK